MAIKGHEPSPGMVYNYIAHIMPSEILSSLLHYALLLLCNVIHVVSLLFCQECIRTNAGRGEHVTPIDISVQGRIFE